MAFSLAPAHLLTLVSTRTHCALASFHRSFVASTTLQTPCYCHCVASVMSPPPPLSCKERKGTLPRCGALATLSQHTTSLHRCGTFCHSVLHFLFIEVKIPIYRGLYLGFYVN